MSYVRPEFKIQNLATWQWLPFDPNSMGHMLFELCTIVFLAVDLTLIPLVLAWDIPLTDVWIAFNLFSVLFWTADIGISFSTSFTIDGEVLAGVSPPEIFFWRSTSLQVFFGVACRECTIISKKGVFFFLIDVSFMWFLRKKGFSFKGEVFFKNSILIKKVFKREVFFKEWFSFFFVFFQCFFPKGFFLKRIGGWFFFPKGLGLF